MTPPKRPTKNPKPLGQHAHARQLSVVVQFRIPRDPLLTLETHRRSVERLIAAAYPAEDITVHIRVLGAGSEASEHEGVVGPLAHTEDDIDTIRTARDQDNVETKGRL